MDASGLILLVEDDDDVRFTVSEILLDAGFEIQIASDGGKALAVMEECRESICGIVADINLGRGPNGWDVAKRGRELIPTLPVVYISGADGHDWPSKGVPHSTLVSKPFAPAQLVTAISTLMNTSDLHR